jgi:hypothetical protein
MPFAAYIDSKPPRENYDTHEGVLDMDARMLASTGREQLDTLQAEDPAWEVEGSPQARKLVCLKAEAYWIVHGSERKQKVRCEMVQLHMSRQQKVPYRSLADQWMLQMLQSESEFARLARLVGSVGASYS